MSFITLTDENFEKEIQNADKPVVVDFWAEWCSPCLMLLPILEKLAAEYEDKIIFAKANLDLVPTASQKFGIDKIPTVILFKEGKPISGFVGVRPEPEIREWLEENLKNNTKKEIEKIIKEYQEYAEKNKIKLNPNKEIVERLVMGMLENEKKYGAKYCPCRRITGNREEDKGKICPCVYHKEEIERTGQCHCGLFVKGYNK